MTVAGNDHTTIISEWPKSSHHKAFLPRHRPWKGLSVRTAGDGVAGDHSIALSWERKVPGEGKLSRGRSRDYVKTLGSTSGSYSVEEGMKTNLLVTLSVAPPKIGGEPGIFSNIQGRKGLS